MREPTSATALACLLPSTPGVSVSLPSHGSLRIYHSCVVKPLKWEQITQRHEEEQVLFGVWCGGGSTPVNFLFLLFWLSVLCLHPRLNAGGCLAFSIPLRLAHAPLFIPELQPRAMAHSLQLAPHPTDLGQGCSLET